MKIACLSDLHGILPPSDYFEEDCEILFLCGDILPLKIDQDIEKSRDWVKDVFTKWALSLPFEYIVFIAGNHDKYFEACESEIFSMFSGASKIKYLCNSGITHIDSYGKTFKIYGTPYCIDYGSWSFMYSEEELERKYSEIPVGLDILLTHDSPLNISENRSLKDSVIRTRPRYVIHGHHHMSSHDRQDLGASCVYNVSLVNGNYEPIFKPLYLYI